MDFPSVFIVIVNYNGWKDTIECLESLQNISYPNYQVVLVDNGSTNGSLEYIKKWCSGGIRVESEFAKYNANSKPVYYIEYERNIAETGGCWEKENIIADKAPNRRLVLIRSNENLGFSGGNNVGIKYSLSKNADYILLLNNDTVVSCDFIEHLIEVASNNEKVGMVGGKIFYYDRPDSVAFAGGKISLIRGSGYHFTDNRFNEPTPVSFLTGCLWFVKSNVFRQVGLLDEYYFLYVEDVDYCYRVQNYGYILMYTPHSIIYHKEGSSAGRLSPLSLYYITRNRPYFVNKNVKNWVTIILFWFFYIPSRILRSIQSGKNGIYIIKGLAGYFKDIMLL